MPATHNPLGTSELSGNDELFKNPSHEYIWSSVSLASVTQAEIVIV